MNPLLFRSFTNPDAQRGNAAQNALSQAPMTVANGVVFYPSMGEVGNLYYLEAATGRLLGSYAAGYSNACGPAIVDGSIYTGSGYTNFGL